MRHHDRSRLVPDRWHEPHRPGDPSLRARWDALPPAERRRVVAQSLRPAASHEVRDRELVRAVAERRVARHRWSLLAAAVVGWLVLMTVWGIGRSGFPDREAWFLTAGLVAGIVTAGVLARGAVRRRVRAQQVVERLS